MRFFILLSIVFALSSCGGSSQDGGYKPNPNIVNDSAMTYKESNEVTNNVFKNAEAMNYVLDTNGIKISGKFEAANPSIDHYLFYTDAYSGVDIQVFLNGTDLDGASVELNTSINAYLDDGLSTLHGLNKASNAQVTPASFFVIFVTPQAAAAGQSYTIQMRAAQ